METTQLAYGGPGVETFTFLKVLNEFHVLAHKVMGHNGTFLL